MKPADRIKAARERAGITQQEAATRTGYSLSAIQKFEQGRITPPARSMEPMLAKLETTTTAQP